MSPRCPTSELERPLVRGVDLLPRVGLEHYPYSTTIVYYTRLLGHLVFNQRQREVAVGSCETSDHLNSNVRSRTGGYRVQE